MKYPLFNGKARVILRDREIAKEDYVESHKIKRVHTLGVISRKAGSGIKTPGEACQGEVAPPATSEDTKD